MTVGSRVRVVDVAPSPGLSADEWADARSMVGEVLEVYELDEWGQAWVSKDWFREDGAYERGHSMGLDSHEMELVEAGEPPPS